MANTEKIVILKQVREIEGIVTGKLEDVSARLEQASKTIDAVVKAFGMLIGAGVV